MAYLHFIYISKIVSGVSWIDLKIVVLLIIRLSVFLSQ